MPELAAFYSVGFIACLALTTVYVYLRRRRRQTVAAQTLQTNLQKAGLYWSDDRDIVIAWQKGVHETEIKRSQSSVAFVGFLLSFLSWAGVFFLLIIMLSERFFARSRRERRIFASVLARTTDLTQTEVEDELTRLDVLNLSPAGTLHPS